MAYRVGIGYDIHRLVRGRRLFLGGIEVPYKKGLLGHSDGDALVHAICDALLGAMGSPDIGELFPDTDPKYRGISSIKLLNEVCKLIKKKKYRIQNIDSVVVAEEPAITPFKIQMLKKLSAALKVSRHALNIKAKTNNGLGDIGGKSAIACFATAILKGRG